MSVNGSPAMSPAASKASRHSSIAAVPTQCTPRHARPREPGGPAEQAVGRRRLVAAVAVGPGPVLVEQRRAQGAAAVEEELGGAEAQDVAAAQRVEVAEAA